MKITNCTTPIPDENSDTKKIKNCCNFGKGCWQCMFRLSTHEQWLQTWCYMAPKWKHWELEQGYVRVDDDLTGLHRQLDSNFQLKSNLLASSSHDPLHDSYISTFSQIIDSLSTATKSFWNGHKLHILSKRIARLFSLDNLPPTDTRIWATITTPTLAQTIEYQKDTDPPSTQTLALRRLHDIGYEDLGISFGPMFSDWKNIAFDNWVWDELPPLNTAQFEIMNHGHTELNCLTQKEVDGFAQRFKNLCPDTTVHLKSSPFEVGKILEETQE